MTRIGLVAPDLRKCDGLKTVFSFLARSASSAAQEIRCASVPVSSKDGRSVVIRKPGTWGDGPDSTHYEINGVPVRHFGGVGVDIEWMRYWTMSSFTRYMKECDIIQVVSGTPALAVTCCGIERPLVVQTATRVKWEREGGCENRHVASRLWNSVMTAGTSMLDRIGARIADVLFVENTRMKEWADASASGTEVILGPPGIDTEYFCPGRPETAVPDSYILFVGRPADPRKNIGLLLDAYSRLASKCANLRLVIAGRGGLPNGLLSERVKAQTRERIQYLGEVTKGRLRDLYRGAQALVLPSREEGLGLVLLEAMACGCPVIATKSAGPVTIIEHDKTGILVERSDAAGLASAIARIVQDTAYTDRLARISRNYVNNNYSHEVCSRRYIEKWLSIAG